MIYWDYLLDVPIDEVCETLKRMYMSAGLQELAAHLGVGATTLRNKLVECGVEIKERGGSHPRIERLDLPKDVGAEKFAEMTGYTLAYSRKLLRRLQDERKRKG